MTARNSSTERSSSSRASTNVKREESSGLGVVQGRQLVQGAKGLVRTGGTSSPELGRRIAQLAAAAGLDRKAEDVQIIDVVGKVDYADYIVLLTGASDRNVAAIARGIEADLAKESIHALALEGLSLARWVLIDFVEVVVHVFQSEWRQIYDLDGLWMDAPRVPLLLPPPATKPA
jgi:ribosome-associated protein